MRQTTKRIFAPAMKELETTPKPKRAAMRAMTSNATANCNMVKFSLKKCWAQLAKRQQALGYQLKSATLFRAAVSLLELAL